MTHDDAVLVAVEPIAASKGHATKLDRHINFADGVLAVLVGIGAVLAELQGD
jgi:hypothetical protein